MAERKNTKWVPVLWQRRYRGVTIWTEEVYATGLRWEWNEEVVERGEHAAGAGTARGGRGSDGSSVCANQRLCWFCAKTVPRSRASQSCASIINPWLTVRRCSLRCSRRETNCSVTSTGSK